MRNNLLRTKSRIKVRDLTLIEYYRYAILRGYDLDQNRILLHSEESLPLICNSVKKKRSVSNTLNYKSRRSFSLILTKSFKKGLIHASK